MDIIFDLTKATNVLILQRCAVFNFGIEFW